MMLSNKIKAIIAFVFVAVGMITLVFYFKGKDMNNRGAFKPSELLNKISKKKIVLKNEVVIQVDEEMSKVDVVTGEIKELDSMEKQDFSGFSGLPAQSEGEKIIAQNRVIFSADKTKAIVTFVEYDSNIEVIEDFEIMVNENGYICDIEQKKCEASDILFQKYDGLDIKKENFSIIWSKWDSYSNLLFGYLSDKNIKSASPIYACDTVKKVCKKTEGFDSMIPGDVHAVVPEGAFSPSLEKVVIVSQNDGSEIVTGKKWELLLFSTADFSKPLKKYDISAAIDRDGIVSYDSVYSVAWNQKEDKLAIATTRKIFVFNFEKDSLSLAYVAPSDEDGDATWNNESIFLSPDGKYVVFADEEIDNGVDEEGVEVEIIEEIDLDENGNEITMDSEESVYVIGVLKKIDLENNNSVSELLRGYELSLDLQ